MLDFSIPSLIARLIVLFIGFPIHELAHALTADYFGDDTPRLFGRLTLNPLAHLDLLGSMLVLLTGFGWAKPVQINPYLIRRRSASGVMWVSLAGPFSNFLMAMLSAVPLRFHWVTNASSSILYQILYGIVTINLLLMLFNLIPIAPLDGEKVADFLMPAAWVRTWESIRPYGPVLLLILLFAAPMVGLNIIGWLINPPLQFLSSLLIG